jgi:hypothetical protein
MTVVTVVTQNPGITKALVLHPQGSDFSSGMTSAMSKRGAVVNAGSQGTMNFVVWTGK